MAEEPKRDIHARLRDLGLQFMEFLVPLKSSKDTIILSKRCHQLAQNKELSQSLNLK